MTCTACCGPSSAHPIPSHLISSHRISLGHYTHYISRQSPSLLRHSALFLWTHIGSSSSRTGRKRTPKRRREPNGAAVLEWWSGIQRIQHILRQIIESGQWSERPQSWDGTDERDRWSDPSMWVFKNRDSTEDNPRDIISILGPTLIRVILQPALSTFNWICLTHVNAAATPPESTRLVISEDSYWYLLISACPWAHAQYSHRHRTADPQSCRPPHAHQSGLVALISRSSTDIL